MRPGMSLGETDGMTVMRTLADRQAGANLVLLTGADQAVINGARKVADAWLARHFDALGQHATFDPARAFDG